MTTPGRKRRRIAKKVADAGGGLIYDPSYGWRYGFPKPYRPLPGETLEQTLLRDGYPQREIDNGGAKHCRFLGSHEALQALRASVLK